MAKIPNLFTFSDSIENNQIVYANLGDSDEVMSNPAAVGLGTEMEESRNSVATNNSTRSGDSGTNAAEGLRQSSLAGILDESQAQAMEKLVLPWTDKYWNLFITNPKSTVEIWARLIGPEYSVSFKIIIIRIFKLKTLIECIVCRTSWTI